MAHAPRTWTGFLLASVLAAPLAGCGQGGPSGAGNIEVLDVVWTGLQAEVSDGQQYQFYEVAFKIRNNSQRPLRTISAKLTAFDDQGRVVGKQPKTLVYHSEKPLAPGEVAEVRQEAVDVNEEIAQPPEKAARLEVEVAGAFEEKRSLLDL
jgi:hypothetical protein